jgi:hypothetical protein
MSVCKYVGRCNSSRCEACNPPAAPELPDDNGWFCPQCGPLEWAPISAEDEIAGVLPRPIIDEDGCCAGCGATCCEMAELRRLLATQGLTIVDAKDRAVLEAMGSVDTTALRMLCDGRGGVQHLYLRIACEAELARREKP